MRLAVALALFAFARPSHAQDSIQGTASVLLGLHAQRPAPPEVTPAPPDLLALDARIRAMLGRNFGAAFGLDFTLGGAFRGGFVHAVSLPIGAMARVGDEGYVALTTGVGFGGVTTRVPEAFELPLEVSTELDLGRTLRLVAWARLGWAFGDAARSVPTPSLPFAHALDVVLGLRFGSSYAYGRAEASSGYVIALTYGEALGGRALGLALSFSMAGGTTHKPRRRALPE